MQCQFDGVQASIDWSGTAYTPDPTCAWFFRTGEGSQSTLTTFNKPSYAVAVRPGDVATSVPEPQTLALALLALGATVVAQRRRPR